MIAQVQQDGENGCQGDGQAALYPLRCQRQLESMLEPGAL